MPLGVRSDLKPDLFYQLIQEKGYNCLIQHCVPCGNIDEYTNTHPKNCPLCHGTGFVYYDAERTKVVMTNLSRDKRFIQNPELLLGQAYATVDQTVSLWYRDRIVNLDALIRYSQLVKHSPTHIDSLRYPVFAVEDVFRFGNINDVMKIEKDVDYRITDDYKLEWISSTNRPNPGELYSIRYQTHPSWIVISFPHVIRETTTRFLKRHESTEKLPLQAVTKLEFLFYKDQSNWEWIDFYTGRKLNE